jgi:hypothetical protein
MIETRFAYEEYLKELSPKEQLAELRQFFIDMMDWTEQSPAEDIYILSEKNIKIIAEVLWRHHPEGQNEKTKL